MKIKSLTQLKSPKNKVVLLRVDYNVAIKNKRILEEERIRRSLGTIEHLLKKQAKVVIMSHLGRPDGKKNLAFTMQPIAKFLSNLLRRKVNFVADCRGSLVQKEIAKMKAGDVLILENLRFYPGEEKNDLVFAKELATGIDYYVNDAFAVCHRAHASVAAITRYLPAYAGLNLEEEVSKLGKLLRGFKKPSVAIIGGVKISTKIKVIDNLLKKYDQVLLGGALANNFFQVMKINIGQSIYEKDFLAMAKVLMAKAKKKLVLPLDVRIAYSLKPNSTTENVTLAELAKIKNKNFQIVDIGPRTEIFYEQIIKSAKTVIWNGPLGIFEIEPFSHGTLYIGHCVALHAKGPSYGVVGGGETIAALEKLKVKAWPDFVSTAGGAMLEFLEGKTLPGLKPLYK